MSPRHTLVRLTLAASCAIGAAAIAASAAQADVGVYAPNGTPRGTLTGVSSIGCITPSGKHFITPGVGMWTSAGASVASSWGSVAAGSCVADGSGNVIVGRKLSHSNYTLTKYTLKGKSPQTFAIAPLMSTFGFAIDLAPDECTVYYEAMNSFGTNNLGRFDVCTGTQLPNQPGAWANDLQVLDDWRVLSQDDPYAVRHDPTGAQPSQFYPPGNQTLALRSLALAADQKSFWSCCSTDKSPSEIYRFDLDSGAMLAHWTPGAVPAASATPQRGDVLHPGLNVYAPPLVGSADIASTTDTNPAGTAQAFRNQSAHGGPLSKLNLYLDATSTASSVKVGIYSEVSSKPGALLAQATISSPRAGSWNAVDVSSAGVSLAAGTRYWIAVLAPAGAGSVQFRAVNGGGRSETSAQTTLTALPATWTTGAVWTTAPVSAFGS